MLNSPSFRTKLASMRSDYTRRFDLDEYLYDARGAMLPIFNNDDSEKLTWREEHHRREEVAEATVQLRSDSDHDAISNHDDKSLGRSASFVEKIRRKLHWLRNSTSLSEDITDNYEMKVAMPTRETRRAEAMLQRTRSSAQKALDGLRFINKTTNAANDQWREVELRFEELSRDGLVGREDFGECIGMADSKEFAVGIFDALSRRKGLKMEKITREELYGFWLQISDQCFDARLQIFFDMADRNGDGRVTKEEVQELIMVSASANKLSQLKEQAQEYASLIMEELDPENLGYIELWQLEALLLQRDNYMNYSRALSTGSVGWSQNLSHFKAKNTIQRLSITVRRLILGNWKRNWIIVLWVMTMGCIFVWKFNQYKKRAAFLVMGYCLSTAKGAAETLKLNMALILLPVCRNTLTWLRSTRARHFLPLDDNVNLHKIIACAIGFGTLLHAGNHLACDFPRLINSSPQNFASISFDFSNKKPTYRGLLTGIEGATGILMFILMTISFTLAIHRFRKNVVKLPSPFTRFTGFNAFWYSHHLFAFVYILLLIHGSFLFFVHQWYEKTTWMYISVPVLLYLAERSFQSCRSKHSSVKILKALMLPGNVLSLILSKPNGFQYQSGQYIFLKCPSISSFEWHPFSITSAPGDNYLSVHIRTVGDWTQKLKQILTKANNSFPSPIGQAMFGEYGQITHRRFPKLIVDGPYGAPAQDYRNYDILLLVGLGIGTTPFISILKDLLNNNTKTTQAMDSNTDTSRSSDDNSSNSFASSNASSDGKKRTEKIKTAHFYWVTREPESFEWFKGVMNEVAEMDDKGQIELHNYLTSVYEEGDARSTLLTMIQALNHTKHGVDILSGTRAKTHFARPDWREVFKKLAAKHPSSTVGVFYCGVPVLAKELRKLSQEMSHKTSTRFEFHKEYF